MNVININAKNDSKQSTEVITAKQTFISYDLKTVFHVNIHENESKDEVMTNEVLTKSSDHIQASKIIDTKGMTEKITKSQIINLIEEELHIVSPSLSKSSEPKYDSKAFLLEKLWKSQNDNDVELSFFERNWN